MSVRWIYRENPNQNGGCLCHPVKNVDQPGGGMGFHLPIRQMVDPGEACPHVFRCEGCACDDPLHGPVPETVDSTAVEITEPPKPAKRKAAPATD